MSSSMHDAVAAYAARAREPLQLVAWSSLPAASLIIMVGEAERRERFGYALREALKKRELSERQLALRMKLDPRKVATWRTGKKLPDLFETQILAGELRVSEELFRNPPPVPKPPAYPIERYLLESLDQVADAAVDSALAEQAADAAPVDPHPTAGKARR